MLPFLSRRLTQAIAMSHSLIAMFLHHYRQLGPVFLILVSLLVTACGGGSSNERSEEIGNPGAGTSSGSNPPPQPATPTIQPAAINLRWAALPSAPAKDIAYGNGRYVFATSGGILTSTDGALWLLSDSRSNISLEKVIFAAGIFAGHGADGTIYTSSDGLTWTLRNGEQPHSSIQDLFYSENRFVAVSPQHALLTSSDGITWNRVASSDVPPFVSFVGGRYFGGGSHGMKFTSTDGATWVALPSLNGGFLPRVLYVNGQYISLNIPVFYSYDLRSTVIHTSPDGVNWTRRLEIGNSASSDGLTDLIKVPNGIVAIGNGYVMYSTDGVIWERRSSGVDGNLRQISAYRGQFVALNTTGRLMTSPDGIAWRDSGTVPHAGSNVVELTTSSGALMALTNNNVVFVSQDGEAWSVSAPLHTPRPHALTFGKGLFVGAGEGQNGSSQIWTSSDGYSWQLSPMEGRIEHVEYANGLFIALGKDTILTSEDAKTWTRRVSSTGQPLIDVAYGNGKFVALGRSANYVDDKYTAVPNEIWTSTDGISWSAHTSSELKQLRSIAFGNGRFVAVGGLGSEGTSDGRLTTISSSEDGIVWKRAAVSGQPEIAKATPMDVTFANGQFVAVGYGAMLSSTDGLSWQTQPNEFGDAFFAVTYGDGQFVAAGIGSAGILATSVDGKVWKKQLQQTWGLQKAVFGNKVWVVLPNYVGVGFLVSP